MQHLAYRHLHLGQWRTIRDNGAKIFFSRYDAKAEDIATLYAVKKWGKQLVVKEGHIMFQKNNEVERPAPEMLKKQKGLSR